MIINIITRKIANNIGDNIFSHMKYATLNEFIKGRKVLSGLNNELDKEALHTLISGLNIFVKTKISQINNFEPVEFIVYGFDPDIMAIIDTNEPEQLGRICTYLGMIFDNLYDITCVRQDDYIITPSDITKAINKTESCL